MTTMAQVRVPVLEQWIGGEYVRPSRGEYFEDRNPLDDSLYARAAEGSAEDICRAVEAAHAASATYRWSTPREREIWLSRAADLVERDRQEIFDMLVDEVGSPASKASGEIQYAVVILRAAAGMARWVHGDTIPSDVPNRFNMTVREPLGVVAGISPFNVPFIKNIKQSAMALATGNTFVLLPSEETPRVAHFVARVWHEAGIPAGAFNVVTGNGAKIGDVLTTHPLVRGITFTGSSRVGQHIAQLAAQHFKKYTLELGGKSPMVVFADADLNAAAEAGIQSIFTFQGQLCAGSSRIYVERPVAEAFLANLSARARSLRSGELRDASTVLCPVISPRQRERVKSHIADAVSKGATLVTGGDWNGNQCTPTILAGVRPEMRVFDEETFGPVVSVYLFDTMDEAMAAANNTVYGLSSSVFTCNVNKAMLMARGIRAGMVHINGSSMTSEAHAPFGGVGISGVGREGTYDIEAMTELKWISITLPADATRI